MEITGKNVIVTGGGRGLGKQFAVDLQNLGAKSYVIDVIQDDLDALKDETGIPGCVVDVTDEKAVEDFFEKYTAENGAPHVLINNAGITSDHFFIIKSEDKIEKFPRSNWDRVIDINLTGVFLCGREAAYHMVKNDVKGLIINISSISKAGNLGQTNYSAAKSGLVAMTVTWAKELARHGVRAAAIAPGYIMTDMVAKIGQKVLDKIASRIPAGRLGEMEEISKTAQYIIECDFFNGRVIEVDGGHRL